MQIRNAIVRAVRTAIQVAAAAIPAAPVAVSTDVLKTYAAAWAFAGMLAVSAFSVALLQNLAEDNSSVNVPK